MSAIYKARPAAKSVFETATQYLNYFLSTWLLLPLWQSWSDFGRLAASVLLKNSNQRCPPNNEPSGVVQQVVEAKIYTSLATLWVTTSLQFFNQHPYYKHSAGDFCKLSGPPALQRLAVEVVLFSIQQCQNHSHVGAQAEPQP